MVMTIYRNLILLECRQANPLEFPVNCHGKIWWLKPSLKHHIWLNLILSHQKLSSSDNSSCNHIRMRSENTLAMAEFHGFLWALTLAEFEEPKLDDFGEFKNFSQTDLFIKQAYDDNNHCNYCGWKKSCTTLDGWNPIINGMFNGAYHLSTAGFRKHPLYDW